MQPYRKDTIQFGIADRAALLITPPRIAERKRTIAKVKLGPNILHLPLSVGDLEMRQPVIAFPTFQFAGLPRG